MSYTSILISALCGLSSLALVLGLIFNKSFRKDVIGGEGEAQILGVVTAKGAVIVLLGALFLGGTLYPVVTADAACSRALGSLRGGLKQKGRYNVVYSSHRPSVESLQQTINDLMSALNEADKSCR